LEGSKAAAICVPAVLQFVTALRVPGSVQVAAMMQACFGVNRRMQRCSWNGRYYSQVKDEVDGLLTVTAVM